MYYVVTIKVQFVIDVLIFPDTITFKREFASRNFKKIQQKVAFIGNWTHKTDHRWI